MDLVAICYVNETILVGFWVNSVLSDDNIRDFRFRLSSARFKMCVYT